MKSQVGQVPFFLFDLIGPYFNSSQLSIFC